MPWVRANSPPPPAAGPGAAAQAARDARAIGRRNVIEERLGMAADDWLQKFGPPISTGLTNSCPPEKARVAAAPEKERVLIIGGGFAGIAAARGLKVEIVKTGSRPRARDALTLGSAAHESVN